MFTYIENLFTKAPKYKGASYTPSGREWQYEELLGSQITSYVLPKIETLAPSLPRNQSGSSSCVYQAIAKGNEFMGLVLDAIVEAYSAAGYTTRGNKPGEGSNVADAIEWFVKGPGLPLEKDVPSQNMTEAQMNAIDYEKAIVGKILKKYKIRVLWTLDFDTIVREIAVNKAAALLGTRCNILEWNQSAPRVYNIAKKDVSHATCAGQAGPFKDKVSVRGNYGELIEFTDEPVIITDDSWGNLGYMNTGKRIIDEKFWNYAKFVACFFLPIGPESVKQPIPVPQIRLTFNMRIPHVISLQRAMKILGYMDSLRADNTAILDTDFYGNITRHAVKRWQTDNAHRFIKYGVTLEHLRSLDGKVFGEQSRLVLQDIKKELGL